MLKTILLLMQVTSGFAADGVGPFDGQWTGSATPTVQQCKSANVTVTVEGTTVIGQAQFANDAPNINARRCPGVEDAERLIAAWNERQAEWMPILF